MTDNTNPSTDVGGSGVGAGAPAPSLQAPVPAPSSLEPEWQDSMKAIESAMGDRRSFYWRGGEGPGGEVLSAAEWQSYYGMLARGMKAGSKGPLDAPAAEIDPDFPIGRYRPDGTRGTPEYDYSPLSAVILSATDRDLLDDFAGAAREVGIGQAKLTAAVRWGLAHPRPSQQEFRTWAASQGFSRKQAQACVNWFQKRAG